MKSLIVILLGLFTSWHYSDLESESTLYNLVAPIGVFVFLVSLCLWLVLKAGFGEKTDGNGFIGSSSDFGGDGGGDC